MDDEEVLQRLMNSLVTGCNLISWQINNRNVPGDDEEQKQDDDDEGDDDDDDDDGEDDDEDDEDDEVEDDDDEYEDGDVDESVVFKEDAEKENGVITVTLRFRRKDGSSNTESDVEQILEELADYMGSCASCQCTDKDEKEGKPGDAVAPGELQYEFEQSIIDGTIMKSGKCTHAAIVGFPKGELRAWAPSDFIPKQQCIKDIINAFKGDVDGLAERGIDLGNGITVSVPGKMDEDKAIYGNDGQQGGSSAFKAANCILIMSFGATPGPTVTNRLGMEMSDHLKDNGY